MLGGVNMGGLALGASGATGGSFGASDRPWAVGGALSCFSGEMPAEGSGKRRELFSTKGEECG